jgi:ribosomal protein S18 acetylase RimI-like enzyme
MAEVCEINPDRLRAELDTFADLLCACVDDGASIGFLRPMDRQTAWQFWEAVCEACVRGERRVFVALKEARIAGCVQLCPIAIPNQPHRAEISKLIVHPSARRQGLARKLMIAAEFAAKTSGRTLLTLDTAGAPAAALYDSIGYVRCGGIPGFALDADGTPEPNIFYYKSL